MKKTMKMRALFFSMVLVLLCVTIVPTVNAGEKWYDNQVEESEADIIASIMADKTEVRPGDEITVTFSVDKMPDNGLGLKAINARIAYDPTKLTILQTVDEYDYPCDYIVPGDLGEDMGLRLGTAGTVTDAEAGYVPGVDYAHKVIGIGKANEYPSKNPGTLLEIKFKVNEGATGNLGMFIYPIKPNGEEGLDIYSGFNAAGAYRNESGIFETNVEDTYYLNYNIDEVEVVNPTTKVYFDGIKSVTLDTVENTSKDVSKNVVIVPEGATDADTITWRSDNEKVATVSNGIITAVGKGTANIIVTVGNHSATLPVTVTVPVTGVEFDGVDEVNLDLTTNPKYDLSGHVKLSPTDAEAAGYNWKSDNTEVATVDENGVVTAVGKGTANITVEVSNHEATIPVNVKASVGSVSFDPDLKEVVLDTKVDTTEELKDYLVFTPEDPDYTNMSWTSSDPNVATVDNNGKVTAVGNGNAIITVNVDGKTATIPVSVTVPLESITVEKSEVTLYKNESVDVKVTANPDGAKWKKLDASIKSGDDFAYAEETQEGVKITGLAEGTSVVTVAANDGDTPELVKEITVNVKENRITSVDVTAENDDEILRGNTKQLKTSYEVEEPGRETTDDKKVTWTSSDEEVATVDENGVVTGLKDGKATITATIAGKSDTYEVTVKEVHVEGIVISDETIENLQNAQPVVGDTIEIPFTVNPEDCTDVEEEILEFVKTQFDEEMVDVTVSYDEETKTGTISVTTKKAGTTEVTVEAGEETYVMSFNVTEPVTETPDEEEAPETADMPVVAMTIIMTLSIAGIVASRKMLVK